MTALFYFVYDSLAWPLMWLIFRFGASLSPKLKAGFQLRQAHHGIKPWLAFPARQKPIWIHCASGEFEYAKPVIALAKKTWPKIPVFVSYFSPSFVASIGKFPGVDMFAPVPWDTPGQMREFLKHHQPRALLIARTDAWPEMVRQTHALQIPSLLFSATLTQRSGRARGLGAWVSRVIFGQLTEIFAVTKDDATQFNKVAAGTALRVAGDTRFDQVAARLLTPQPLRENVFSEPHTPIFIAGSTWPEDEAVLIDALKDLRGLKIILVPHEPSSEHLVDLEARLKSANLNSVRYSTADAWPDDQVLIVDQMGILAELYLRADFAFVGGSFRKTVHSVMEPLAAGCLTFVGPQHWNNREALDFSHRQLGGNWTCVVPVNDAKELRARLSELLRENNTSRAQPFRERIRAEVKKQTGGSKIVIDWLRAHGCP